MISNFIWRFLPFVSLGGRNRFAPGTLRAQAPSTRLCAGDFVVDWKRFANGSGQLQIHHRDDPERVLWGSPAGRAFVVGAQGHLHVGESRGSFEIGERPRRQFAHQVVESVASDGQGGVIIRGELRRGRAAANAVPFEMHLNEDARGRLAFEVHPIESESATSVNQLAIAFEAERDEKFFGFGEQFAALDARGSRIPILTQESGVGRGERFVTMITNLISPGSGGHARSTYAPSAHFISTALRSLSLDNEEYAVFDLTQPKWVTARVAANQLRGHIYYGESPLDLVGRHAELVGRQPRLPDWLHDGAVVGMQGGTERVRALYRKLQEAGVPISALWLQDWVGQRQTSVGKQLWWSWQLDRGHYPEWEALVQDLAASGVRVMGYINPMLIDCDSTRGNLYREARERGFLLMNDAGEPYAIPNTDFRAGLVDLSQPEACDWLKALIKERLIGNGFSGWMADFGNEVPLDAVFANGDSRIWHNRYPVEWARINEEAIAESGRADDLVFFARSGHTYSPGVTPLFWEGDQSPTWNAHNGLKSAIRGALSSAVSGMALNHSDVGGYRSVKLGPLSRLRSNELIQRWGEFAAFTPLMRTHQGLHPDLNAQVYGPNNIAHFARMSTVFRALADYRATLFDEEASGGRPPMRMMWLNYPNDPVAPTLEYEYMLGRELLVAPVVEPRARGREIYLPAGTWTHLWSGRTYGNPDVGSTHWIDAPLGEPPVFYPCTSKVGRALRQQLINDGIIASAAGAP